MFGFETQRGVMAIGLPFKKSAAGIAVAAAVAAVAMAGPASAAAIFVSGQSDISGTPIAGWAILATDAPSAGAAHNTESMLPQIITTNPGAVASSPFSSPLAWCLDPFTELDLQPIIVDYQFLGYAGRAYGSSAGALADVGALINYGTSYYNTHPTLTVSDLHELANVQAQIWTELNPAYNFYFVDDVYAPNTFELAGHAIPTGPLGYTVLTSVDPGASQTLGIAAAVPEPATWATMTLGFLGLGFVLRDRRRRAAATA